MDAYYETENDENIHLPSQFSIDYGRINPRTSNINTKRPSLLNDIKSPKVLLPQDEVIYEIEDDNKNSKKNKDGLVKVKSVSLELKNGEMNNSFKV